MTRLYLRYVLAFVNVLVGVYSCYKYWDFKMVKGGNLIIKISKHFHVVRKLLVCNKLEQLFEFQLLYY